MTFANPFARALVPALFVAAVPAAAAESPDMARLNAHIRSVPPMTANFTQTDARGRSAAGTLQLKRPGKVRFAYGSGDLLLLLRRRRADVQHVDLDLRLLLLSCSHSKAQ